MTIHALLHAKDRLPPAIRDKHRREVRRLFKTGMSKRRIAAELGISRTSVRRFLEPPVSAGP